METEKQITFEKRKTILENRSEIRISQTVDQGHNIRISLQNTNTVSDNRAKLNGLLCASTNTKLRFRSILGLISVLDYLECFTLLPFQEAFEIYASYFDHKPYKVGFRDNVLDCDNGLLCCYFIHPIDKIAYLSLRFPGNPVEKVIQHIFNSIPDQTVEEKLSPDTVSKVLRSMDSEYDKQCAKALLVSSNFKNNELYSFGINPQAANRHLDRIKTIVDECDNAEVAAKDIVKLRLDKKIEDLKNKKQCLELKITKLPNQVDAKTREYLLQEKSDLDQSIEEQNHLKGETTTYHQQKFRQAVKRTAENLIDENRVKRRKQCDYIENSIDYIKGKNPNAVGNFLSSSTLKPGDNKTLAYNISKLHNLENIIKKMKETVQSDEELIHDSTGRTLLKKSFAFQHTFNLNTTSRLNLCHENMTKISDQCRDLSMKYDNIYGSSKVRTGRTESGKVKKKVSYNKRKASKRNLKRLQSSCRFVLDKLCPTEFSLDYLDFFKCNSLSDLIKHSNNMNNHQTDFVNLEFVQCLGLKNAKGLFVLIETGVFSFESKCLILQNMTQDVESKYWKIYRDVYECDMGGVGEQEMNDSEESSEDE